MQTKLHRWAVADPGRRFDDLFNFVHDPATLLAAFDRVAGNRGARTPGIDGLTATAVEELVGVPGFMNDLQATLKDGSFRPVPVRERSIPKPGGSGKVRKLGIPTIADRVVQAALKLVLEPIFEADFKPVSYGFRPRRRAQDAIAEIHYFGSRGYRWVLDADIEACFDSIDHTALMGRHRFGPGKGVALAGSKARRRARTVDMWPDWHAGAGTVGRPLQATPRPVVCSRAGGRGNARAQGRHTGGIRGSPPGAARAGEGTHPTKR